ncbi:hypothetical protein AgCh_022078 [Apium graveolens]
MLAMRTTARKRVGNGQLFRRLFGAVPQAFADAETWKLARPHQNVLACLSYWTTQEDMLTAGIFHNINMVTIENAGLVEKIDTGVRLDTYSDGLRPNTEKVLQ